MKEILKRLEGAKKKLMEAENNRMRLLGKQEAAMEELSGLGFDTVKQAQVAVAKMDQKLDDMEIKLGELVNDFESKYSTFLEQ